MVEAVAIRRGFLFIHSTGTEGLGLWNSSTDVRNKSRVWFHPHLALNWEKLNVQDG